MYEPESRELLRTLDIGAIVRLDDESSLVELIDYTQPQEYGPGVWAYADAETGDYYGLVTDGAHTGSDVLVDYHGDQL